MLSLYYNESKNFLHVNAVKMYQLATKGSETNPYSFCVGNMSKDFTIENINKQGLKEVSKFFLLITMLMILVIFQISTDI